MLALLAASALAADPDPLTAFATGAAAYLTTGVVHEVGGHGTTCALAGGHPTGFSSTFMVCDTAGLGPGDVRAGTFMGTGANLLVGTTMATSLLAHPGNGGWTYHYLWTASSVQLFLGGSYMVTGSLFGGGDFGAYLSTVDPSRRGATEAALVGSGLAIVGATFPITILAAEPMLGDDRSTRTKRKFVLGWVPYLGAGVGLMTATGALNHEKGPVDGATAALLGYGLGTLYYGYMPLFIRSKPPESSEGRSAPSMTRSTPWIAIGAASIVGLAVFGYGIGDLDESVEDNYRRTSAVGLSL